jgi:hypothetical protein
MAAEMGISNAAARAALDAKVDLLDVGGAGSLKIYQGTRPDKVDSALAGETLLSEHTLSLPAFGAAADASPNATATAGAIGTDNSANNTGTAQFFRAFNGSGTAVIDGNVGTSSADLILDSVSITAGQQVSISSWVITELEE